MIGSQSAAGSRKARARERTSARLAIARLARLPLAQRASGDKGALAKRQARAAKSSPSLLWRRARPNGSLVAGRPFSPNATSKRAIQSNSLALVRCHVWRARRARELCRRRRRRRWPNFCRKVRAAPASRREPRPLRSLIDYARRRPLFVSRPATAAARHTKPADSIRRPSERGIMRRANTLARPVKRALLKIESAPLHSTSLTSSA